jgi:hypothetical protein
VAAGEVGVREGDLCRVLAELTFEIAAALVGSEAEMTVPGIDRIGRGGRRETQVSDEERGGEQAHG